MKRKGATMSNQTINQIKLFRELRGYSQVDLAKKLKVNPLLINMWENNICLPSTTNLIHLSNLLQVSCHDLLISESKQALNLERLTTNQKIMIIHLYRSLKKVK